MRKEALSKELQGESVTIVPYIETVLEGLELSWRVQKPETQQQKLSIILEEEVSGIGV